MDFDVIFQIQSSEFIKSLNFGEKKLLKMTKKNHFSPKKKKIFIGKIIKVLF